MLHNTQASMGEATKKETREMNDIIAFCFEWMWTVAETYDVTLACKQLLQVE